MKHGKDVLKLQLTKLINPYSVLQYSADVPATSAQSAVLFPLSEFALPLSQLHKILTIETAAKRAANLLFLDSGKVGALHLCCSDS